MPDYRVQLTPGQMESKRAAFASIRSQSCMTTLVVTLRERRFSGQSRSMKEAFLVRILARDSGALTFSGINARLHRR
jgi:hypothetical protein